MLFRNYTRDGRSVTGFELPEGTILKVNGVSFRLLEETSIEVDGTLSRDAVVDTIANLAPQADLSRFNYVEGDKQFLYMGGGRKESRPYTVEPSIAEEFISDVQAASDAGLLDGQASTAGITLTGADAVDNPDDPNETAADGITLTGADRTGDGN